MVWPRLGFVLFSLIGLLPVRGAEPQSSQAPAIRAARRGTPYLFLGDGRTLSSNYAGSSGLTQALGSGQAHPLAMASADFDEDGMPDLASGYSAPDGTGVLTVHRGNVDALWPYGKALRHDEPPAFLKDARIFALPEAPDFLGAGDFNADGHWDLVAAHSGSRFLYYLRGDGHGGFAEPERIALPGVVTALTTGEINRVDGLTDIAVGITAASGAEVLVFESPAGALRGKPEHFAVPAPVSALAMMPLDDDGFNDLAVGAGNQLLEIHGRDRKLSYPKTVREAVPGSVITRQTLPFAIHALASGHFIANSTLDLAALGDDGKVHFLERPDADYQAARAELPVALASRGGLPAPGRRGSRDAGSLSAKPAGRELVVRDEVALPAPAGPGARLVTARTSITGADDVIVADSAGAQLHVLGRDGAKGRQLQGASPLVRMHLAASLEASAGAPAAVLPMRLTPSALHALVVLQAGQADVTVMTQTVTNVFTVTNAQDPGANAFNTYNETVPGSLRWAISSASDAGGTSIIDFNIPVSDPNYNPNTGTFTITVIPNTNCDELVPCSGLPPLPAGTVLDGYTQPGGTLNGITQPAASPNTLVNGDNAVVKIVISGAKAGSGPDGIWLFNGGNTVRGMNVVGFHPAPNADGLTSTGGWGVNCDSSGNYLEGNFLGVDSTGTQVMANYVGTGGFGGPNIIGGTTPGARNLVTGNTFSNFGSAVAVDPQTYFVEGNYIGTDRTGTISLSSTFGLGQNGTNMVIGGTTAGAGNLLTGSLAGLELSYPAGNPFTPDDNLVQGNLVGTDPTGTTPVGNSSGTGMVIQAGVNNLIGGTTPAARNLVSGNGYDGMSLDNAAQSTTIQGNYVGVDTTGTVALANSGTGIDGSTSGDTTNAYDTLIGGESPQAGNVVSGNLLYGMQFGGVWTPIGTVLGNWIGTDVTGTKAVGNGLAGISLIQDASSAVIGGADTPDRNVIAYNGAQGVIIDPANRLQTGESVGGSDSVAGNSIFSNGSVGVEVASGTGNTVSRNSIYSNGGLGIDLNNKSTFQNNSCPPNTKGANSLQNAPVLTAAAGASTLVTATATDPNGNTSEFSNCVAVSSSGSSLNIAGSLTSTANTTFTIEFFENQACDPSKYGQGQTFLNSISVTTNASCLATFGDTPNTGAASLSLSLGYNSSQSSLYVTPGENFSYLAVVTNHGAGSSAGVSLNDTLAAGVTLVSASTTQGTCSASENTVSCSLGTLASGATARITITVTITGVGTIANTASVSATTPNPNSANDTSALNLTSNYLAAAIDHFSPASTVAGVGALPLTIYLLGFYPGLTSVTVNGTVYSSSGLTKAACGTEFDTYPCQAVTVTIPASLTASASTLTIGVSNPSPGGNGGTPNTQTFTVYPNPGTVTQLLLSLPSTLLENTSYNLTVTAANASGQTVPGYPGVVLLQDDYGIASFNPPSPYQFTAADNGSHTFSVTFSQVARENLSVSDAGTPSIATVLPVTVGAVLGAPARLSPGQTPDNIPIGFPFPQPLSVTVTDATYNQLPGITVTFTAMAAANGASGAFSNGQSSIQVVTDSNGNASAAIAANQTAGQFQVNANVGSLVTAWYPTSTSNVPANITIVDGNPQSSPINTQYSSLLDVLVTDASGNPVLEVPVTFTAPATGPSLYLASTTAVTTQAEGFVQAGEARLDPIGVANGITGTYQVIASIGGLKVPFTFTNNPGQPAVASLDSSGTPQYAAINSQFASKLAAVPRDANGDCLSQVTVTFSAPASGPSATLSASSAVSDPKTCTAQVTATANGIAGVYNVTATAPGGVTTTYSLTNLAGATTLLVTGGTPQSAAIGTQFQTALQATLLDANGNPLTGRTVNFTAPSSGPGATLSDPGTTTDLNGNATTFATANSAVGGYTVTAAYGSAKVFFSLTNVAPPAVLSVTSMHSGSFTQGQIGATYTLTVSNAAGAGPAVGAVTVTEVVPPGLTLTGLSGGNAWSCTLSTATCTRSDALQPGSSYSAIMVTVDVSSSAAPSVTNQAAVQGGGSLFLANASDITSIIPVVSLRSPCDVNNDTQVNILDVQLEIKEGLGSSPPLNDLNSDGKVNVVDIQIVINAALNKGCTL